MPPESRVSDTAIPLETNWRAAGKECSVFRRPGEDLAAASQDRPGGNRSFEQHHAAAAEDRPGGDGPRGHHHAAAFDDGVERSVAAAADIAEIEDAVLKNRVAERGPALDQRGAAGDGHPMEIGLLDMEDADVAAEQFRVVQRSGADGSGAARSGWSGYGFRHCWFRLFRPIR